MTTSTLTLADFLLARIAEDEAAVEGFHQGSDPEFFWGPARVFAECEAKREVVQIATDQIRLGREARGWDNWEDMANQTLRALALPYADHADFNPDWRP